MLYEKIMVTKLQRSSQKLNLSTRDLERRVEIEPVRYSIRSIDVAGQRKPEWD